MIGRVVTPCDPISKLSSSHLIPSSGISKSTIQTRIALVRYCDSSLCHNVPFQGWQLNLWISQRISSGKMSTLLIAASVYDLHTFSRLVRAELAIPAAYKALAG